MIFEPDDERRPAPRPVVRTDVLWATALEESEPSAVPWNGMSLNLIHRTRTRATVELHPGFVHHLDRDRRQRLFAERYATRGGQCAPPSRPIYELPGSTSLHRALRRWRDAERRTGKPHSEAFRVVWAIVDGRYQSAAALADVMRCGVGRIRRLAGVGLRRLFDVYLAQELGTLTAA